MSWVVAIAIGLLATLAVWPERDSPWRDWPLMLSLSIGLGLSFTSLTYFLWVARLRSMLSSPHPLDVGLTILLIPVVAMRVRSWKTEQSGPDSRRSHGTPLFAALTMALASLDAAAFLVMSRRAPFGGWDALATWNLKARYLAFGGADWTEVIRCGLADYPLLLSGAIARIWYDAGHASPLAPALIGALFTFATAGLLIGGLRRLRGPMAGWLGGTLLLATPSFLKHGARQYADIPVAFFILATVVLLTVSAKQRGENRSSWGFIALAALFAGFAAWTKNEGELLVAVLALVLLVGSGRGRHLSALVAGLTPALVCLAYFKVAIAPANDLVAGQDHSTWGKLLDPRRYARIAEAFAVQALTAGEAVFPSLALYGWLNRCARPRLEPWLRPAAALLALMTIGYFFVYVTTPHDLAWHLRTSLDRLVLQLLPGIVFVAIAALTPEEYPAIAPASTESAPAIRVPTP